MYAFSGEMSRDVRDERIEVHCLSAILSEQDFESVGGLSALAVGNTGLARRRHMLRGIQARDGCEGAGRHTRFPPHNTELGE